MEKIVNKKVLSIFAVAMFLMSMAVFAIPVSASSTVTNINTGETFTTIQAAIDDTDTLDGHTIVVGPGTYNEVVNVYKAVTLHGEDGAIIKPDDTTALLDQGVRRVAIYITVDDVTIEGFEIDGTGGHVHYGIYGFNTYNVVVEKNKIHDIVNEIASPVGDVAGVGILFFGWGQGIDHVTIKKNDVYNTGRMGIFVGGMQSGTPYNWLLSSTNTISRNNVYNTWQGPTNDAGGAIQIMGAKSCTIERNDVYDTGCPAGWFYPGIYLAGTVGGSVSRNDVYNNLLGLVIWVNPSFVNFAADTATPPTLYRNDLYDNSIINLWII